MANQEYSLLDSCLERQKTRGSGSRKKKKNNCRSKKLEALHTKLKSWSSSSQAFTNFFFPVFSVAHLVHAIRIPLWLLVLVFFFSHTPFQLSAAFFLLPAHSLWRNEHRVTKNTHEVKFNRWRKLASAVITIFFVANSPPSASFPSRPCTHSDTFHLDPTTQTPRFYSLYLFQLLPHTRCRLVIRGWSSGVCGVPIQKKDRRTPPAVADCFGTKRAERDAESRNAKQSRWLHRCNLSFYSESRDWWTGKLCCAILHSVPFPSVCLAVGRCYVFPC